MSKKSKVFGVGMHRTGTTSLRAAMPILGYQTVKPWRWMGRFDEQLTPEGVEKDALHLAKHFDAAIYMPFMTVYPALHAAYPDAKFILTLRNEEAWADSVIRFFGNRNWPEVRFAFGVNASADVKDELIRKYREHNGAVRNFFSDKSDQLLKMRIDQGDGWDILCDFLNEEIPEQSFPRENGQTSAYASVVKRLAPTVSTTKRFILGNMPRVLQARRNPKNSVSPTSP